MKLKKNMSKKILIRFCKICDKNLKDEKLLHFKNNLCHKHFNEVWNRKKMKRYNDMIIRLNETGRKLPSDLVALGHKRGVLCLACGVYADGLICKDCKELDQCKLCGIVKRAKPIWRIFGYLKRKDVCIETFVDVKAI